MYEIFNNKILGFLKGLCFNYLGILSYENYFQRYQTDNSLLLLLQKKHKNNQVAISGSSLNKQYLFIYLFT